MRASRARQGSLGSHEARVAKEEEACARRALWSFVGHDEGRIGTPGPIKASITRWRSEGKKRGRVDDGNSWSRNFWPVRKLSRSFVVSGLRPESLSFWVAICAALGCATPPSRHRLRFRSVCAPGQ